MASNRRMEKLPNIPRQLTYVRFTGTVETYRGKEWIAPGEILMFLGEMPQMPGHCILHQRNTNKILYAYHTSDFQELTEEEI